MTTATRTGTGQKSPAPPPGSPAETMRRYPRLTAHLICESLGYFTPKSAANAILQHRQGREFGCEWYSHMASGDRSLLQVGADTLQAAFRRRRNHRGYMAEYARARTMVQMELAGDPGPTFSSWE